MRAQSHVLGIDVLTNDGETVEQKEQRLEGKLVVVLDRTPPVVRQHVEGVGPSEEVICR